MLSPSPSLAERKLRAMAPVSEVISALRECDGGDQGDSSFSAGGTTATKCTVEEQDRLAVMIQSCWPHLIATTNTTTGINENEKKEDGVVLGISSRYVKFLIQSYVKECEDYHANKNHDTAALESDALLQLVLQMNLCNIGSIPNPEESCHLSFVMMRTPAVTSSTTTTSTTTSRRTHQEDPWLHIRIFPHHNDVALRLWEAGATMAEYFLYHEHYHCHPNNSNNSNKNSISIRGKKVLELGAGVGLTGLVLAGCCGAAHVHMTDFTDACLENLQYNCHLNQSWLVLEQQQQQQHCRRSEEKGEDRRASGNNVSLGYLEWSSVSEAVSSYLDKTTDWKTTIRHTDINPTLAAFYEADILMAADVIYDRPLLDPLVQLVSTFLSLPNTSSNTDPQPRRAIFGLTRRNQETFAEFQRLLQRYNVHCEWLADGTDCGALPVVFPCHFLQSRSQVRLASLVKGCEMNG